MPELRVERRGPALQLTIDREARRNSLNEAVLLALRDGIDAAEGDPEVRAIVITGAGEKVFCAGGDLKPSAEGAPFTVDPSELDSPVAQLFLAMERSAVPIVARVNGHALGGGFGLMCACDFAIVVEGARLGTPEVKVGLVPLTILPGMMRVVPRRKLAELCLTGEPMGAAEALDLGVVNAVTTPGDLDAEVDALVGRIAAGSPTAQRFGRRVLSVMADMPYAAAMEYAQRMLPLLSQTEDSREGFAAFNQKRPPRWTGR
jgi:enoyl-CoA hydratase/carnithine racemase